MKRIGVITCGGDCGGLNAVVKSVTQTAASLGIETLVVPNGYAGLYNLEDLKNPIILTPERVDSIDANLAGSEAGHSRVKISKIKDPDKYRKIKTGLSKFNIDGLVISGGDDTGSVMCDLIKRGIRCVHVPKTMDLDLQPYSVGGDSSLNRIAQFTEELKTTGLSHNRIMIVEVFGRYVGHTAFRGGIGAEADCILIPEIPVDLDVVYNHMKKKYMERVKRSDVRAGTYTIVVSEGITDAKGDLITDDSISMDAFGHKKLAGAGKYVRTQLEQRMNVDPEIREFMKNEGFYVPGVYELPEIREVIPGHLVRSGHSSEYDVNFGKEAGSAAVRLLVKGIDGVTVVKIRGNKIYYMTTIDAIKQRRVNLSLVPLFEAQGVCFGREPLPYKPDFIHIKGEIERHL
ncbi:MAG TPA: 6-phosphofructokinase [Nitrospirae bacterium]|nr:6-phosphofructokinase [Nitrospirota bacterium]HDZ87511.1 6-phosphofructokinase [Nitrospirota bacterium]